MLTNLGDNHWFISEEYYCWEDQSKATRAYAQRRQYHIIVESRNS